MPVEMGIGMCAGMHIEMCIYTCMDLHISMCTDMCADTCADVCRHWHWCRAICAASALTSPTAPLFHYCHLCGVAVGTWCTTDPSMSTPCETRKLMDEPMAPLHSCPLCEHAYRTAHRHMYRRMRKETDKVMPRRRCTHAPCGDMCVHMFMVCIRSIQTCA